MCNFHRKVAFQIKFLSEILIAFVFLFDEYEDVYFDQHFWMMARGAGKTD